MSDARQVVQVTDLMPYIGQQVTVGDRSGRLVGIRRTGRGRTAGYDLRFEDDPGSPMVVPGVVSVVID